MGQRFSCFFIFLMGLAITAFPASHTLTVQINSSANDVEENRDGQGGMYFDSSDLELVYDQHAQTVGLRFENIAIPKNAIITDARIQFQTDEKSTSSTSLILSGHKTADAPIFGNVDS